LNEETKPLIICGTGGHAKVLANILVNSNEDIIGFIDPHPNNKKNIFGIKVLGDDSYLNNLSPEDVTLVNGLGSLPNQNNRSILAKRMRDMGFRFTRVIHQSAVIGAGVIMEEGVQVMAGVVIQPNVHIGEDTIINTGALIDHDCVIGRACHIAPGAICSGGVKINNEVHVGTGTNIIQNISIGNNTVIAAGSTIFEDIASNQKVIQKKFRKS